MAFMAKPYYLQEADEDRLEEIAAGCSEKSSELIDFWVILAKQVVQSHSSSQQWLSLGLYKIFRALIFLFPKDQLLFNLLIGSIIQEFLLVVVKYIDCSYALLFFQPTGCTAPRKSIDRIWAFS